MSSSTSMKAYLAAHYMSGPKAEAITARLDPTAKKKKKKAKATEANTASSSFIKDMDDDLRWGKPVNEEEDEEEKAVVEKDRSFKKRKVEPASQANDGGGWITVEGGEGDGGGVEEVAMEDVHVAAPAAGLVMPAEFKSALPQAEKKKKKKSKQRDDGDPEDEQGETVYRDASGRRIQVESAEDIAARQAEEERQEREKLKMKKSWQKGLVQKEQAEARRREEEKERSRNVARHADDKDLNEMQKAEERWNDPAAAFLTKKEKKGPKRPEYKGPPPPPNRFGIKPGYRWDGVDRSNGFEKKYFQTINEKGRTKLEAYQWSVDDM